MKGNALKGPGPHRASQALAGDTKEDSGDGRNSHSRRLASRQGRWDTRTRLQRQQRTLTWVPKQSLEGGGTEGSEMRYESNGNGREDTKRDTRATQNEKQRHGTGYARDTKRETEKGRRNGSTTGLGEQETGKGETGGKATETSKRTMETGTETRQEGSSPREERQELGVHHSSVEVRAGRTTGSSPLVTCLTIHG